MARTIGPLSLLEHGSKEVLSNRIDLDLAHQGGGLKVGSWPSGG